MRVAQHSLPVAATHTATRRRELRWLMAWLALTDLCILLISFELAYIIRFELGIGWFEDAWMRPLFYSLVMAVLVPGYLLLFRAYGLYTHTNLFGGTGEYTRLFNAVAAGSLLVIATNFLIPEFVIARAWLLIAWGLVIVLGLGNRFAARRIIYRQRLAGRYRERTLIIGAGPEGIAAADHLRQSHLYRAEVVGFVDDALPVGQEPLANVPVLGSIPGIAALIEHHEIDNVIVSGATLSRAQVHALYSVLQAMPQIEVHLVSGILDLVNSGVRVRDDDGVPLVMLNRARITGLHLLLKTLLDYAVATAALLVLLPFFAVVAILVRLDSPGPAFYRRRVVGQARREFDAFKFRTMHVNGDALLTPEQRRQLDEEGKLKDDPRVTRVGAFLRRYSLDELPQLVNVLRGEMSLIGPRMITRRELDKFGHWQCNLTTVKPGLTGLWQISGRSDLSYDERVQLDMQYIRHYSIWLDVHILLQTIPALLSGRGAY